MREITLHSATKMNKPFAALMVAIVVSNCGGEYGTNFTCRNNLGYSAAHIWHMGGGAAGYSQQYVDLFVENREMRVLNLTSGWIVSIKWLTNDKLEITIPKQAIVYEWVAEARLNGVDLKINLKRQAVDITVNKGVVFNPSLEQCIVVDRLP